MKVLMILVAFGAAAFGAASAMFLMENTDSQSPLSRDDSETLNALSLRIDRLSDDIEEVRGDSTRRADFEETIAGLRRSLNEIAGRNAASSVSSKAEEAAPDAKEISRLVEEKLKEAQIQREIKKVEERAAIIRRKRVAQARDLTTRLGKTLELNASQEERLESDLATYLEDVGTSWGRVKNDQLTTEERLSAIERLRGTMSTFLDSSRSYLSDEQYNGLRESPSLKLNSSEEHFAEAEEWIEASR